MSGQHRRGGYLLGLRGDSSLAIQSFFKFLAGSETGFTACRNLDGGTGARVAAHTRFRLFWLEYTQTPEIDFVAADQGIRNSIQRCVYCLFDFRLRLTGGGGD